MRGGNGGKSSGGEIVGLVAEVEVGELVGLVADVVVAEWWVRWKR